MDWFATPPAVIDRLISLYSNSPSFATANTYGRTLRQYMQETSPTYKQANEIIRIASHNDQIKHSNELPSVLRTLGSVEGGMEVISQLMSDHGLEINV